MDVDVEYDDIWALFDINDLQSPVEEEGQDRAGEMIVGEARQVEPLVGDEDDEADQNDWMKVFVPSLLMAGFPRQLPSSDIADPQPKPIIYGSHSLPAISNTYNPPLDTAQMASNPILSLPNNFSSSSAIPLPDTQDLNPPNQSTSLNHQNGFQSSSPPWSLSALQYPFQTLDLYGNSFHHNPAQFSQLPPPLTPSYPMLEYLNFPETPGAPKSARMGLEGIPINTAHMGNFGEGGYPNLSDLGGIGRADGWDMFRTISAEAKMEDNSLKRKRGRESFSQKALRGSAYHPGPRCSFAQTSPKTIMPSATSSSSNSTPATTAQFSNRNTQQIKTQVGLEAELKLAVNELNDRVRVILVSSSLLIINIADR